MERVKEVTDEDGDEQERKKERERDDREWILYNHWQKLRMQCSMQAVSDDK